MSNARVIRRCTRCGCQAESVHILPHLATADLRVELACRRHDPGGYWFYIGRWFDGPPDWRDPSRPYTVRDHLLDVKVHGQEAVELVDAALEVER